MGGNQSMHWNNSVEESSLSRFERVKFSIKFPKWSRKVSTVSEAHRKLADSYFKVMLTHSVVVEYFRNYCMQKGSYVLLDFYLRAAEVRRFYKEKNLITAMLLFDELVDAYMPANVNYCRNYDGLCDEKIRVKPHPQSAIFCQISNAGKSNPATFDLTMENLRMAQHCAMCSLKENLWLPFCDSSMYKEMMARKEVQNFVYLYKTSPGSVYFNEEQFSFMAFESAVETSKTKSSTKSEMICRVSSIDMEEKEDVITMSSDETDY